MSLLTDKLIKEETTHEKRTSFFGLPFFLGLFVISMALFIGDTLFGKNSLEVYLALQKDESILEKKIFALKTQNATLQKKYFELKNIMPSGESE